MIVFIVQFFHGIFESLVKFQFSFQMKEYQTSRKIIRQSNSLATMFRNRSIASPILIFIVTMATLTTMVTANTDQEQLSARFVYVSHFLAFFQYKVIHQIFIKTYWSHLVR